MFADAAEKIQQRVCFSLLFLTFFHLKLIICVKLVVKNKNATVINTSVPNASYTNKHPPNFLKSPNHMSGKVYLI